MNYFPNNLKNMHCQAATWHFIKLKKVMIKTILKKSSLKGHKKQRFFLIQSQENNILCSL